MDITREFNDNRQILSEKYLDIKTLIVTNKVRVFALCEKATTTRDVSDSLFIRYTLRDINGCRITARQTNIDVDRSVLSNMSELSGNIVVIEAIAMYWNGLYLKITDIRKVNEDTSDNLRKKFFTSNIDNFDSELSIHKDTFDALANNNIKLIYENFNVEIRLTQSHYLDICSGKRGSPIKILNTFNACIVNTMDRSSGRMIILANTFVEAIISKAQDDVIEVIRQLDILKGLICDSITPELKELFTLVEDTIYLEYNYNKQSYSSNAVIVKTTREAVYNILKDINIISQGVGLFEYNNKLLQRGS